MLQNSADDHTKFKEILKKSFNRAASTYDAHALIQKITAEHLVKRVLQCQKWTGSLNIADVGCGTGFVSELLTKSFPNASYLLNDLSRDMLKTASEKIRQVKNVSLFEGDAETNLLPQAPFDLIVSNLTVQWFRFPEISLSRLFQQTKVFGFTLFLKGSFEQWDKVCEEHGIIPYQRNEPSFEQIKTYCQDTLTPHGIFEKEDMTVEYPSLKDFLISLEKIGACIPTGVSQRSKLHSLLKAHPKPFPIRYHIFYGVMHEDIRNRDRYQRGKNTNIELDMPSHSNALLEANTDRK